MSLTVPQTWSRYHSLPPSLSPSLLCVDIILLMKPRQSLAGVLMGLCGGPHTHTRTHTHTHTHTDTHTHTHTCKHTINPFVGCSRLKTFTHTYTQAYSTQVEKHYTYLRVCVCVCV